MSLPMHLTRALRALAAGGLAALVLTLGLAAHAAPLIVLDAGHNPGEGAISVQGLKEVVYNDRFVAELAPALERAGWRVALTREPGQKLDLAARPALANRLHADVFLSIHHDSAQLKYLRAIDVGGVSAWETTQSISGPSLYVSRENPRFDASLQLATRLGERLHTMGRAPNLMHAEPIQGENHPLLDHDLGIYEYNRLAVLRHAKVPAVLLEVGVITDRTDEAWVADAGHRQRMIGQIVQGLTQYRAEALQAK